MTQRFFTPSAAVAAATTSTRTGDMRRSNNFSDGQMEGSFMLIEPPRIANTGRERGTSTVTVPFGGRVQPAVQHRVSKAKDPFEHRFDSLSSQSSASTEHSTDSLNDFEQVGLLIPHLPVFVAPSSISTGGRNETRTRDDQSVKAKIKAFENENGQPANVKRYAEVDTKINPSWFTSTNANGNEKNVASSPNPRVYILLETTDGRYYDAERRRLSESNVEVERGSLLVSLSVDSDPKLSRDLKLSYEFAPSVDEPIYLRNYEFSAVFLRVSATKILLLTEQERLVLLGIPDCEIRYQTHEDLEEFSYIVDLKIGSPVGVQIGPSGGAAGGMAREAYGRVAWMGELQPQRGLRYGVTLDEPGLGDMDGNWNGRRLFDAPRNGAVLCSADLLHKPEFQYRPSHKNLEHSQSTSSSSIVRNVPIRIVSGPETSSISKMTTVPSGNMRLVEQMDSPHQLTRTTSVQPAIPRDCRAVPITVYEKPPTRNDGRSRRRSPSIGSGSTESNGSIGRPASPPRAFVPEANYTQRPLRHRPSTPLMESTQLALSQLDTVAPETHSRKSSGPEPLRIGDRVVWFDLKGRPRRATVRWIGDLRGHSNTYVGAEFDEKIGGGTGRYEGVELFRAEKDHAGFLPLHVVMRESDLDVQRQATNSKPLPPLPPSYGNAPNPRRFGSKESNLGMPAAKRSAVGEESVQLIDVSDVTVTVNETKPIAESNSNEKLALEMGFAIGSCVEAKINEHRRCGVIKWIGHVYNEEKLTHVKCAAIELETNAPPDWPIAVDGRLLGSGVRLYTPPSDGSIATAAVIPLTNLQPDLRFTTPIIGGDSETAFFGNQDSGTVMQPQSPNRDANQLVGPMRGIQGHRNSCYLDATLYAMFVQSDTYDRLLNRPRTSADIPEYGELLQLLANEIVFPLRRQNYVRADHMVKFRRLLSKLVPDIPGLTCDEKDPEEFLMALFTRLLKAKPFLRLRNQTDKKIDGAYLCPLIVEDLWTTDQLKLIDIQYLMERSMHASSVEFAEAPDSLIIQLPRYGQQKVFNKIVPLLELDITNLIYDAPRPCAGCGRLADMMCPECYLTKEVLLSEVTFCPNCFDRAHPNRKSDHAGRSVCSRATLQALSNGTKRPTVKRKMLQLTAVLCIETSHYVSFVRISGTNRWLFFDSMADRVGLEDGYNIPQVKSCDQVGAWLSPAGCHKLRTSLSKDRNLPIEVDNDALVKRLLSDAYICFYSSEPLPYPPSGPPSSGTNEKHRRDGESIGTGNGVGHLEVGKAKFFV